MNRLRFRAQTSVATLVLLLWIGSSRALDAQSASASAVSGSDATAETWGDYSMMGRRRSGQIWASGRAASRFRWVPKSETESDIYWGDPDHWPPEYHERFIRDGDWVMLDGWWGNGTYYTLRVDKEELCDQSCNKCSTIATSGPQYYVKWRIPAASYCLRAQGIITEQSSGKTLRFGHTQVYSGPTPCSNTYYSGQRCIRQWESWWDDRGTPYQKKVEREQQLAKSIGQGFTIHQHFPKEWQAELRQYSDD